MKCLRNVYHLYVELYAHLVDWNYRKHIADNESEGGHHAEFRSIWKSEDGIQTDRAHGQRGEGGEDREEREQRRTQVEGRGGG